MSGIRVAILGGDARELRIAELLLMAGHEVAAFGIMPSPDLKVEHASSAGAAVRDAKWIICPSPGLSVGDEIYAPNCLEPIVLDDALLAVSDAQSGGVVLGFATPSVRAAAEKRGISLIEMRSQRSLAISNATAVAEALVSMLIGMTSRVLPDYRYVVVGYGATGAAFTDSLLGLSCRVTVVARRPESLERARQRGAAPFHYDDRRVAMAAADVIVNTTPSEDAIPPDAFASLQQGIVIDIASPPGGIDHQAAMDAGLNVTWARGLAGKRAPLSVGDAQFEIIKTAMERGG